MEDLIMQHHLVKKPIIKVPRISSHEEELPYFSQVSKRYNQLVYNPDELVRKYNKQLQHRKHNSLSSALASVSSNAAT